MFKSKNKLKWHINELPKDNNENDGSENLPRVNESYESSKAIENFESSADHIP